MALQPTPTPTPPNHVIYVITRCMQSKVNTPRINSGFDITVNTLSGTKRIRVFGQSCTCRGWSRCVAGWWEPSTESERSPESGSRRGWTDTCRETHNDLNFLQIMGKTTAISAEETNSKQETVGKLDNKDGHKHNPCLFMYHTVSHSNNHPGE